MPAQDLHLTLLQKNLVWEDKASNLKQFNSDIQSLSTKTDLIVLPEMFTTGFTMNAAELAEPMDGPTMEYLHQWSADTGAVVTGSFISSVENQYFNRLVWMHPDGHYQTYDKRHLFTLADEHHTYTAGTEKLLVEIKGWKVCPLICYDLRFPVWSRNSERYDLLIYIANFPAKRAAAWKNLLLARAIENQVYTIGVNRVGTDGKGFYYSGDSSLIDFEGHLLYQTSHIEDIFSARLSQANQEDFRKRFAFLNDQDVFTVDGSQ